MVKLINFEIISGNLKNTEKYYNKCYKIKRLGREISSQPCFLVWLACKGNISLKTFESSVKRGIYPTLNSYLVFENSPTQS